MKSASERAPRREERGVEHAQEAIPNFGSLSFEQRARLLHAAREGNVPSQGISAGATDHPLMRAAREIWSRGLTAGERAFWNDFLDNYKDLPSMRAGILARLHILENESFNFAFPFSQKNRMTKDGLRYEQDILKRELAVLDDEILRAGRVAESQQEPRPTPTIQPPRLLLQSDAPHPMLELADDVQHGFEVDDEDESPLSVAQDTKPSPRKDVFAPEVMPNSALAARRAKLLEVLRSRDAHEAAETSKMTTKEIGVDAVVKTPAPHTPLQLEKPKEIKKDLQKEIQEVKTKEELFALLDLHAKSAEEIAGRPIKKIRRLVEGVFSGKISLGAIPVEQGIEKNVRRIFNLELFIARKNLFVSSSENDSDQTAVVGHNSLGEEITISRTHGRGAKDLAFVLRRASAPAAPNTDQQKKLVRAILDSDTGVFNKQAASLSVSEDERKKIRIRLLGGEFSTVEASTLLSRIRPSDMLDKIFRGSISAEDFESELQKIGHTKYTDWDMVFASAKIVFKEILTQDHFNTGTQGELSTEELFDFFRRFRDPAALEAEITNALDTLEFDGEDTQAERALRATYAESVERVADLMYGRRYEYWQQLKLLGSVQRHTA